jgi:molecular chaperone GrpE
VILPSDDDARKPGRGDPDPSRNDPSPEPKRPQDDTGHGPLSSKDNDDGFDMADDQDDPSFHDDGTLPLSSGIKAPAPPGWREDLRDELDDALDELAEIEDPTQDFDPPDPPDLFTFYGELAALRNELRRAFRRSSETAEKFGGALQALASGPQTPINNRSLGLALVSLADRIAEAPTRAPVAAALQTALQAAGVEVIETIGKPFDPSIMSMVATASPPRGTKSGTVLAESVRGYRNRDGILRPASVTVAAPA